MRIVLESGFPEPVALHAADQLVAVAALEKERVGVVQYRERLAAERRADELEARLKALESENARLKKILADRDLELDVMREINRKKW